jgi:pimeloyl-ACP methyl ester carboxylesterase
MDNDRAALAAAAEREGSALADSNGILLCHQEFGDPANETILLVMGLGMQMLAWDEGFCELLAGRGFHVVRYDNRDTGLSTKFEGRVNVPAGMLGLTGSAVYDVDDMAADAIGLLDHLRVDRAHIVGASMGGMIAQQVAAHHPGRVASLTSIMSTTGRRRPSTMPRFDALRILLSRPAASREEYVESVQGLVGVIGSPDYPPDPERLRAQAERSWDRCHFPAGIARQLVGIMASGDRTADVRRIQSPTLVIHGLADRLVPPRGGRDTAAAIRGARLELIEGMGHDLPQQLWGRIGGLITDHARAAAGSGATAVAG